MSGAIGRGVLRNILHEGHSLSVSQDFPWDKMNYLFFPVHECLMYIPDGFLLLLRQQERWLGWRGFSSVQSFSLVWLFFTPWTAAHQASLSITNSLSLLKVMSIKLVMPSNHLILYLTLFLLPSIFCSIRVFSNGSVLCIRLPKYWSFTFSISPSNEYSGLVSFKIDGFDPLAVQGTLKSLLQCHSSKASFLWCSAFFMVYLSHPYMATGKSTVLTMDFCR